MMETSFLSLTSTCHTISYHFYLARLRWYSKYKTNNVKWNFFQSLLYRSNRVSVWLHFFLITPKLKMYLIQIADLLYQEIWVLTKTFNKEIYQIIMHCRDHFHPLIMIVIMVFFAKRFVHPSLNSVASENK